MAACVFVGWPVKQTLYMWKVTWRNHPKLEHSQDSGYSMWGSFLWFQIAVEYTSRKSCEWHWRNSHQVSMPNARKKPLRKNNGEHFSETTYIIKGRPLHPSSNNNWVTPPITPNDILINQNFPPPQSEPEEGSTSGSFWEVHKIESTNSGNAGWDISVKHFHAIITFFMCRVQP